jgi:hypothetical protein
MEMAEWILLAAGGYAAAGALFAAAFVGWGVGRVDPLTREAGWGFRLLLLPGAALLWPCLLRRWIRAGGGQ